MNNEEALKKMIIQAKMNGDDVLVEHLTKALEHVTKTKIVETFSNGNTTYTRYKSGKTKVESDYYNIKFKANNSSLKSDLTNVLGEIVIDEIRSKKGLQPKSLDSIAKLIIKAKSQEDIDDIKNFLEEIAQVGPMGNNIKNQITEYMNYTNKSFNTTEEKPKIDKPNDSINVNNQIRKIAKEVALLDMRLDEMNQNSLKDPDEHLEIAGKYNKAARDLEAIAQTINDSQKRNEIIKIINNLEQKAIETRVYANKMEELSSSYRL